MLDHVRNVRQDTTAPPPLRRYVGSVNTVRVVPLCAPPARAATPAAPAPR